MVEEQAILSVGSLVRGRYVIKSVLDSGSTGAVYLVKDQKDQEPQYHFLVLKEIRVPDQQARYHFTIGGTPLRQLQYPTLPRVHTLFNDDKRGCVYVVMEYIEGERLADLPWGHLSWPELRIWCEPLIATLSYLHGQEQPLFHGDLKPTNLVRTRAGKIMLVDIGYVPQESDASQPNPYRAPEQFAGILDARSDVYGCGALLYTLLTGAEPADAFTRHERVSKKKTDSLVLASKLSASLSRELAEVLQRALALDPAERFSSVKAFWDALSPLAADLDGQQISLSSQNEQTTPASNSQAPALPVQRTGTIRAPRRMLLPTIAAVAALLLLASGVGAWIWGMAHSHSSAATTSPSAGVTGTSTPVPGAPTYPAIVGRYSGTFTPAESPKPVPFTVIITQQRQQQFSGQFISTQQNGSISGVIDTAGDLHWTIVNSAGNAVLYFYGGLNGIASSQNNTQDNMGGTFSACKTDQGPQCTVLLDAGSGGSWSASFVSSAFTTPAATWS